MAEMYKDGDRFVKLYGSSQKKYVEETAARQRFAASAGIPVPEVYGVVDRDGGVALEMKYIVFKPFTWDGINSADYKRAMEAMAGLQAELNSVKAPDLPLFTDLVKAEILKSPYLYDRVKDELLTCMRSLDKSKGMLCHGDLHTANVLYDGKRHLVIDWGSASRGDPEADACNTYLYELRFAPKGWAEVYLEAYCRRSGAKAAEVRAWLPVMAGYQVNIKDDGERAFIIKFIHDYYHSPL